MNDSEARRQHSSEPPCRVFVLGFSGMEIYYDSARGTVESAVKASPKGFGPPKASPPLPNAGSGPT